MKFYQNLDKGPFLPINYCKKKKQYSYSWLFFPIFFCQNLDIGTLLSSKFGQWTIFEKSCQSSDSGLLLSTTCWGKKNDKGPFLPITFSQNLDNGPLLITKFTLNLDNRSLLPTKSPQNFAAIGGISLICRLVVGYWFLPFSGEHIYVLHIFREEHGFNPFSDI